MKSPEETIRECEEAVKGPGKFEGEARYIPYFYDAYLDGLADEDDDDVLVFQVSPEDTALFPELKQRSHVRFYVRDDGFVCEVG